MLKLTLPLFSGFETLNSRRSAAAKTAAIELNLQSQSKILLAELENTLDEVEAYAERLNIEEKNLSKSEEYYRLTLGEYKRGVKNSPDMVGAAERLTEVKIRNLEFRKDIALAKLKVLNLVNQ